MRVLKDAVTGEVLTDKQVEARMRSRPNRRTAKPEDIGVVVDRQAQTSEE